MSGNDFSQWLIRQIESRKWTRSELARRAGVSTTAVSDWTLGRNKPDAESADKLAEALGFDRDLVLAVAGIRPVEDDDSPLVREFIAKVRRVDWTVEGRAGMFDTIIGKWLEDDRKQREGT